MLEKFRAFYNNYLSVKLLTVTLVVFVSIAVMIPLIKIAELFGINLKENSGTNFEVTVGNVFFFFLFGLCTIGVIWLAQKYIHRKKLAELGFHGRMWKALIIGFVVGAVLVSLKYTVLILSAENVKYIYVIPKDISIVTYLGYYSYFIFGFIFWNSFIEELATRAYPIQKLKDHINPHIIFIIMGLIFTLGHFVLNEFTIGYFLSLFLFSYSFSLLYYYSNSIWLPIGVHSGVNWVGFSLSGTNWKLGAIYNVEMYNVPNWSYHYGYVIILAVFLLLIVFLNKKGFFRKYFPQ